jgi:hypothetical protein
MIVLRSEKCEENDGRKITENCVSGRDDGVGSSEWSSFSVDHHMLHYAPLKVGARRGTRNLTKDDDIMIHLAFRWS